MDDLETLSFLSDCDIPDLDGDIALFTLGQFHENHEQMDPLNSCKRKFDHDESSVSSLSSECSNSDQDFDGKVPAPIKRIKVKDEKVDVKPFCYFDNYTSAGISVSNEVKYGECKYAPSVSQGLLDDDVQLGKFLGQLLFYYPTKKEVEKVVECSIENFICAWVKDVNRHSNCLLLSAVCREERSFESHMWEFPHERYAQKDLIKPVQCANLFETVYKRCEEEWPNAADIETLVITAYTTIIKELFPERYVDSKPNQKNKNTKPKKTKNPPTIRSYLGVNVRRRGDDRFSAIYVLDRKNTTQKKSQNRKSVPNFLEIVE